MPLPPTAIIFAGLGITFASQPVHLPSTAIIFPPSFSACSLCLATCALAAHGNSRCRPHKYLLAYASHFGVLGPSASFGFPGFLASLGVFMCLRRLAFSAWHAWGGTSSPAHTGVVPPAPRSTMPPPALSHRHSIAHPLVLQRGISSPQPCRPGATRDGTFPPRRRVHSHAYGTYSSTVQHNQNSPLV